MPHVDEVHTTDAIPEWWRADTIVVTLPSTAATTGADRCGQLRAAKPGSWWATCGVAPSSTNRLSLCVAVRAGLPLPDVFGTEPLRRRRDQRQMTDAARRIARSTRRPVRSGGAGRSVRCGSPAGWGPRPTPDRSAVTSAADSAAFGWCPPRIVRLAEPDGRLVEAVTVVDSQPVHDALHHRHSCPVRTAAVRLGQWIHHA